MMKNPPFYGIRFTRLVELSWKLESGIRNWAYKLQICHFSHSAIEHENACYDIRFTSFVELSFNFYELVWFVFKISSFLHVVVVTQLSGNSDNFPPSQKRHRPKEPNGHVRLDFLKSLHETEFTPLKFFYDL